MCSFNIPYEGRIIEEGVEFEKEVKKMDKEVIETKEVINDQQSLKQKMVDHQYLVFEKAADKVNSGYISFNYADEVDRTAAVLFYIRQQVPFFTNVLDLDKDTHMRDLRTTHGEEGRVLWQKLLTRATDIVYEEVYKKGIPIETLMTSSLSFNEGVSIHYFGKGVVIACQAMAKKTGLPGIKPRFEKYYILRSFASLTKRSELDEPFLIKDVCLQESTGDDRPGCIQKDDELKGSVIFVERTPKAFLGASGHYTIGDSDEQHSVAYWVQANPSGVKSTRVIGKYPAAFIERKFINMCYKKAYGDTAILIDVNEENSIITITGKKGEEQKYRPVTSWLGEAI